MWAPTASGVVSVEPEDNETVVAKDPGKKPVPAAPLNPKAAAKIGSLKAADVDQLRGLK
jgi:hypothetical protein